MFSAISVRSNEVGVILNPTVPEFPKVSFSINLFVFLASGLSYMKLREITMQLSGSILVTTRRTAEIAEI